MNESRPASEYNKEIDLELDSPGLELDNFSINTAIPSVTGGSRPRSMTTERVLASLPPADQGREAYLFLFAGEIMFVPGMSCSVKVAFINLRLLG